MKKVLFLAFLLTSLSANDSALLKDTNEFCQYVKQKTFTLQKENFDKDLQNTLTSFKTLAINHFMGISFENDEILELAGGICKVNSRNFDDLLETNKQNFQKITYKIDIQATNENIINNILNIMDIKKTNQDISCDKQIFADFMSLKETKGIMKDEQAAILLTFDEFKKVAITYFNYENFNNSKELLLSRVCDIQPDAIIIKSLCSSYNEEIGEYLQDEMYKNMNKNFIEFINFASENFTNFEVIQLDNMKKLSNDYCTINGKNLQDFVAIMKEKVNQIADKNFTNILSRNFIDLDDIFASKLKVSCSQPKISRELVKLGIKEKKHNNAKGFFIKQSSKFLENFTLALLKQEAMQDLYKRPNFCDEYFFMQE